MVVAPALLVPVGEGRCSQYPRTDHRTSEMVAAGMPYMAGTFVVDEETGQREREQRVPGR